MLLYMADFETVVEENPNEQKETCVWAWALTRLFDNTERVQIGNTIESFFAALAKNGDRHIICYFHNLKFDGQFITSYLISHENFISAFDPKTKEFMKDKDLKPGQMIYTITDNGIWYSITIKYKRTLIEFRDSLKLLAASVKDLGVDFDCKYRKLEIDYIGHMNEGEEITEQEKAYIRNDVLVVREALEKFLSFMHYEKNPPLTIGQACMREFKADYNKERWNDYFPNLAEIEIDPEIYGYKTADEFIRHSYYGGWCYANYEKTGLINGKTYVYDVNSLYPSVMHGDSGNVYPIGEPHFFPNPSQLAKAEMLGKYYFVRFRCRFDLREGYFPFIQLKYDMDYRKNENLSHSYQTRYGRDDTKHPEIVLSKTLFKLFMAAYEITDFEFLGGCWFESEKGLFDHYINRFMQLKEKAVKEKNKVLKSIAKAFLNSIYGKFGTSPENTFYLIEPSSEEGVEYIPTEGNTKKPVAVQIASAITSYARKFTVTAAIMNSDYYLYSDTDSVHLSLPEGVEPKGINIHESKLLHWKLESLNDHSIYLRQKTYIEYSTAIDENGNAYVDYDIKCCGLPDRGKLIYEANLNRIKPENGRLNYKDESIKLMPEEIEFLSEKRTIKSFRVGLSIPGKLKPKKIIGGCVLCNDIFTIK